MATVRAAQATSTSLRWLVEAAAEKYRDDDVAELLTPEEEDLVRGVLPAACFGWVVAEAAATRAVVRELNEGDSRVPYPEIARASARAFVGFLYRLATGADAPRVLDSTARFAGSAARLGVDSAVVVQSVRIMERRWVDQILAAASTRASEVASHVLSASAAVHDPLIDGFVAEYVVEQSRINGELLARKRALVDALLRPGARDTAGFEDLDVDLAAFHLAVVLWFPAAGVRSQLDALTRQLGMRAMASSVLSVPGDNEAMWIWLSFTAEPSEAVIDRIRSVPRDPAKVGIALGPIAQGVAGFRRTLLLAREYADTARRLPFRSAPPVADAESVSYLSFLLNDRERAEWFIDSELGPVGSGSTPSDEETRETLLIYLESGQSLATTAERLRIHRNTVVYRLRRIEQAIGRPIAERRHEIYAAALLAHHLRTPA